MTAVYGHPDEGALAYVRRGWRPIPVAGKTFPVKGATGHEGVVTDEHIAGWVTTHASWNLALRHDGTIALDIDDGYGDKDGARQLAAWAAGRRLGPLPATWSSTARGDSSPSRQHLYRVPPGLELRGKPCASVEVCQRRHRFTVTWPTVHPDTGQLYRWYGPGEPGVPPAWGRPCPPPVVTSLPWLPREWAVALVVAPRLRTAAVGEPIAVRPADDLVATFRPGPPSRYVLDRLDEVCDPAAHIGHDEALRGLVQGFRLGIEGHPGAADLVQAITARLAGYLGEARPAAALSEVTSLLEWTASIAQARPVASSEPEGASTA